MSPVSPELPRRLRTGLAALLGLALVCGTVAGCGVFGGRPMHISAQFQDAIGLFVGNDVSVLGIKVGTVTAIHPDGTHVVVDLAIDPDVKVPADVGAVTMSPSVVTDRRVELTPVYRSGPTMRDGDLIPLDRTHTPVEVDRLYAAADKLTGQLNSAQGGNPALADALNVAADTFGGNGDKVHQAVHGLAAAVGVGADQRDQLVNLIKDVDQLTQTAANNDGTIRRFSQNLTDATALLDEQGPDLRKTLDNLDELLDQTNELISDNRDRGEDTLRNVRVTAHTLAGRSRELAEAADVLPTLFQNLYNIVDFGRGAARAHAGLDQILLDPQLLQTVCQQLKSPLLCSFAGKSKAPDTSLALLLLGGAR
jgi:phospholipid/cholesterol/gamma-HCH transport system substrate-binding protein